jgi:hypothetical protein
MKIGIHKQKVFSQYMFLIHSQLFFSYENNFLNSDGQQFHQYQQNEQALITSIYQTQKKVTTYVMHLDISCYSFLHTVNLY